MQKEAFLNGFHRVYINQFKHFSSFLLKSFQFLMLMNLNSFYVENLKLISMIGKITPPIKEYLIRKMKYTFHFFNIKVIKWFWKIIDELTDDERRKFLQFCTGTSRVPVEGFRYLNIKYHFYYSALQSNNGKVCKFCIEPIEYIGKNSAFIKAHTCFNRIELPIYEDYITMKDNITNLIRNPNAFKFDFE
jgi:hypothetical protein